MHATLAVLRRERLRLHSLSQRSGVEPAHFMVPSFCCRVLGNADGERFLGAGDHQEVTVVGSYLVLRCLRQAPIGSSASESMRCRNLFRPTKNVTCMPRSLRRAQRDMHRICTAPSGTSGWFRAASPGSPSLRQTSPCGMACTAADTCSAHPQPDARSSSRSCGQPCCSDQHDRTQAGRRYRIERTFRHAG